MPSEVMLTCSACKQKITLTKEGLYECSAITMVISDYTKLVEQHLSGDNYAMRPARAHLNGEFCNKCFEKIKPLLSEFIQKVDEVR